MDRKEELLKRLEAAKAAKEIIKYEVKALKQFRSPFHIRVRRIAIRKINKQIKELKIKIDQL